MNKYTTDTNGAAGGLPEWVRIFRNGNVVHYCRTQADADMWIAEHQL